MIEIVAVLTERYSVQVAAQKIQRVTEILSQTEFETGPSNVVGPELGMAAERCA
jgi:hypothetical protein